MTSLVLGAVGGALGAMTGLPFGAQIGFLVGSLIGNLIDPPKVQGPRIGDTKLQRSSYGQMLPYAWGQGRIGCNVIDQTDLVEHEHKSGGKGGPEVTSYTYSASWLAALCVRLPNRDAAIAGITHLFMDGKLVWSQESGSDCPCTVYLGTEDQEPDPTFEAIHGVGNQPAYRGIAYLAFTDYDLTDWGNRIPQVEAVIYTKGGDIPWRVNTFAPWASSTTSNYVFCNGTTDGTTIFASDMTNGGGAQLLMRKWDFDGNQIGSTSYTDTYQNSGCAIYNSNVFLTWENIGTGGEHVYWWRYIPETDIFENVSRFDLVTGHGHAYYFERAFKCGDYIFGLGHRATDTYVCRVPYNGGAPGEYDPLHEVFVASIVPGNIQCLAASDDTFYLLSGAPGSALLWHFDQDLNLLHYWDATDTAGTNLHEAVLNGYVWHDLIVLATNEGSIGGTIGDYKIRLVKINADLTLEDYGSYISHANSLSNYIGGGLMMDSVGTYSLIPPAEAELLSDVVSDITSLTPAGSADVAELEDDEVRWFVIGQEMTARNAIEKLRPAYFFDAVEEDYSIVFRKRGDRTVYEIDEEDLVPFEGTGDLLRTIRKREQELPRTVTLTYIDVDMDWQTGAQSSPRQVTQSQYDVTLELPIGFTAQEAARVCWTVQCAEWNERESFQWQTTRRWAYITPCTLVKVRGRVIRVQKVTEQPDGKISYEGVLAAPSLYTQTASGASSSGSVQQTPAADRVATELVLLDIPVISQGDSPFGFYAAMAPAGTGSWPGATLFKSLDGGTTWTAVASTNRASVIGETADFPSPAYSGTLASYGGGDVVDESSLCVVLHDADAELETCTADALDRGANLCAISRGYTGGSPNSLEWEICQFRDATLIDTNTYLLTGFKRGRKGTLTTDHDVGDTFVLLPVTNVDAPVEELNVALVYKAVTFGRTLASAAPVDFENTGESTDSFYDTEAGNLPVHVNEQTGTTYTVDTTDRFRLITFNNASPVAVTLPDGMPDGWNCFIENVGAGDVTLTPASWVIDDGASDLTLATDQGILLASDGAQWWTMRGMGSAGGGTYTPSEAVNAQTGTTYTVQSTDRAKLVTLSNTSAVAVTLPQATGSFAAGWYCDVKNLGAGAVTITPTTSTIGGSATLVLTTGRSARIVSDGTNYLTAFLPPGPGVNAQTGTTYTYVSGDRGKLVTHSNGSSIAGTLPQATGAFGAGWFMWVQNRGAGTLTITPTTSTIDGASSITLATGKGALIVSNGTDYYTQRDASVGGTPTYQLEILIGDGVNPILTGTYPTGAVVCPRAGTITGWQLLSCDAATPTAGAIVIDLWRDSYANYPPTVGDSIIPSGTKPTIGATNSKATSSSLTGWTTSFSAGDVIFPNVDSVTSLKAVKLILTYN